jgi:hypothetical protein
MIKNIFYKKLMNNGGFWAAIILLGTSVLFFTACQNKIKGCLDPNATNFDITADDDCTKGTNAGTCPCIYPQLIVGTNYGFYVKNKKGTADSLVVWKANKTYKNSKGQYYNVTNVTLYLSEMQMIRNGNVVLTTLDSVQLPLKKSPKDSSLQKIPKNFTLINSSAFSFPIGSFKENGLFEKVKFQIGLSSPVNLTNSALKSNTALAQNNLNIDSLYLKKSFEHLAGVISYKSDTSKTAPVKKIEFTNVVPIEILFPSNYSFLRGFDVRAKMSIDFSKWFENVDFSASDSDIKKQVISDLPKGWSIFK